jgi:UDP-glucuronate 4-epimerase
MKVLVTGHAGFIGNALALRLLEQGRQVTGIDSYSDYYDVRLKDARVARLRGFDGFVEERIDIADAGALQAVFARHRPDVVVHLAAQAGVRYSLENPQAYVSANLDGFANLLEACRAYPVAHLLYASSSSVYGDNAKTPFAVTDRVDHPVSFYAATKRANELMAHSYSHLYGIPATGFRFFTVYGPWGRPDMAYFEFTRRILAGESIDLFNQGECRRDFTYIDDIVDGLLAALELSPADANGAPHALYNLGNDTPVALRDFVAVLERLLGRRAKTRLLPPQPGDVVTTWADIDATRERFGYAPKTDIEDGLAEFVRWYCGYQAEAPAAGNAR